MLRFSYENILFISLWSGPNLDFNIYLKKYNSQIDELITNGMQFKNTIIKLTVHAFIADSPARSKACNSMQHNGKFGCLMCMHPTLRSSNKRTTFYPLLAQEVKLRTRKMYNLQASEADETGIVVKGIKGSTHLSNWIHLPDHILLDYMHLCLIGTFKAMIMYFLNTANHMNKDLYLGKYFKIF